MCEESKKKTQRKDYIDSQGRLKVVDGDKEWLVEDGEQLHLHPNVYGRYSLEPYEGEFDSLDFCILQNEITDRENKTDPRKLRESMESIEGEPSGIIDIE